MEGNVKGTMYADVPPASRGIIVRLVEDHPSVLLAQGHAEMGLVNPITHAYASLVGLESCATKISHGLESMNILSIGCI